MNKTIKETILRLTNATSLVELEKIQDLWSGYGTIKRYSLEGFELKGISAKSVVVKHVDLRNTANHPRGWGTSASHLRKLKSYQVEINWYKHWASKLNSSLSSACYVPRCFGLESRENSYFLMILEDLDSVGFSKRKSCVSVREIKTCLKWLAHFHAKFLGVSPQGLWPIGTYWHLDTRIDELNALKDQSLKNAAKAIDAKLNSCSYKTFVHGDAKLANFCFSDDAKKVAAVDFQYVGVGCGMKDVAYLIGSCLDEKQSESLEKELLDYYFDVLLSVLKGSQFDLEAIELEWREMYPVAWADFHRFIKGWSPGHWKVNSYSEKLTRGVIMNLAL